LAGCYAPNGIVITIFSQRNVKEKLGFCLFFIYRIEGMRIFDRLNISVFIDGFYCSFDSGSAAAMTKGIMARRDIRAALR